MSPSQRKTRTTYRPPSPPRWKGRDSLELVYQLNERALKLLSDAVTNNTAGWPMSVQHRKLWLALAVEVTHRAARFPFVIVDVHFTNLAWWRSASVIREGIEPPGLGNTCWSREVSEQLMSETLVFAWHTAKWDRRVARLTFGMLPEVADDIAALTPQQLAVLPARLSGALRLRWQGEPEFWRRLLAAARDVDEESLAEIHLHGQLLLSGALLARTTAGSRDISTSFRDK
jgi:hypothetical protein